LGVGLAEGLPEALELGLVRAGAGAEGLGEVPPVPQPVGVGEEPVTELLEAFVPVAEQQGEGGAEEPLGQAAEGGAELSQWGGGDAEMFVGEPEAGGAAGLVTAGAAGVMEAEVDGEVAHGALAVARLGFEPGGVHFAEEGRDRGGAGWGRGSFLQFQPATGAVELDGGFQVVDREGVLG